MTFTFDSDIMVEGLKRAGRTVRSIAQNKVVSQLGLSAALGVAGALGSRAGEKICAKAEGLMAKSKTIEQKKEEKREEKTLKQREEVIASWDGLSCEDMI